MNALRLACISGFLTYALGFATGHCTAGPTSEPTKTFQTAVDPIAQLLPGKTAGTMHLVYHGRAEFSMPGRCALLVNISERYHDDIPAVHLDDAKEFTAEADLRPGSYTVTVRPVDAKDADYWPSQWQAIHIDKAGHLYQPHDWWSRPGVFVLERRMKGVSPDNLAVADSKQPLLRWPAVTGAAHYRGDLFGEELRKTFDVEETQYRIGGGLSDGEWCSWRVYAIDANEKTLARGEGGFFGHGTDEATIARMRAGGGTCGVPPAAGTPYLGIYPLPTQVRKDPATPIEYEGAGARTIQDEASGFIPGIEVTQVWPGSPAVDADLHPDDVIIAIDGKRVPSEGNQGDQRAFALQVAEMEPGRQIKLTVRRFPRELTLHATIGRYPGAPPTQPTQVIATTAPAVPKENIAVAPPASGLAWREVPSGSPARNPFYAARGVVIPTLSTADGLAADWVTSMAELPHGGMAFGTRDGLSIWDGAEIRTYTGPSFMSQKGGMAMGNSGLPANEIQDLLCDSRGRLWVATMYGACCIDPAPDKPWRVLENPQRNPFARLGLDQTMFVQKVFECADGTIVLGASDSAILLIDPKTDVPRLIHSDGDMNHSITGIAEDSRHRLWFSVEGLGVLRYDGAKVEQIHGPWIVGKNLRGLCIDRAGTIWIADAFKGLGALHADGTTEEIGCNDLAGRYVEGISTDRSGRIWVTCDGGIAVRAMDDARGGNNPWQFVVQTGSRPASYVLNTTDGSWWVGGVGISRGEKMELSETKPSVAAVERFKRETEKTYPKVAVDGRTVAISGGIVVASVREQLLRYDGKKWEDLSARFDHVDIYRIRADLKGTIWLATSGQGLIGLDPVGGVRRFNNEANHAKSVIYDMDFAPDGTLYAGTQYGVYRLRDKTWGKIETDQPVWQVGQILIDRHGRVWLLEVTYNNLYVYDGKRFRDVKDQTPLSDERLAWGTLRLDAAGNILVDIPARPAEGVPKRTFQWNASVEGKIGEPVEVK